MINRYIHPILALVLCFLSGIAWCGCLDGQSHLIQVNIVAPYAVELMLAGRWYSTSVSANLYVQTVSVQVPFFDADYVLAIHVVQSPYLLVDVFIDGYLFAKTGSDVFPVWDPSTHNNLNAPAAIQFTVSATQPVGYGWWTETSVDSRDTWNAATVSSQNPGAPFAPMNGQWVSYDSTSGDHWWRLNVSPRYFVDFVVNTDDVSGAAISGKQFGSSFQNANLPRAYFPSQSRAFFFVHNTVPWCKSALVGAHAINYGGDLQSSGLIFVNSVGARVMDTTTWTSTIGVLTSTAWMSDPSMSLDGWSYPSTCGSASNANPGLAALIATSNFTLVPIASVASCRGSITDPSANSYYRTVLPFSAGPMSTMRSTASTQGTSNLQLSAFAPQTATLGQYLRIQWNFLGIAEISAPGVFETCSSSTSSANLAASNLVMVSMPINSFSVSFHTTATAGIFSGLDLLLTNEFASTIQTSATGWLVTSVKPTEIDWWSSSTLGSQWVVPVVCGASSTGFSAGISNSWIPNLSGNVNRCNTSIVELWWKMIVVQKSATFIVLQSTDASILNSGGSTNSSLSGTSSPLPGGSPTDSSSVKSSLNPSGATTSPNPTPSVLPTASNAATFIEQYLNLIIVLTCVFLSLLGLILCFFLARAHSSKLKMMFLIRMKLAQPPPQPYAFPTSIPFGDSDAIYGLNQAGKEKMSAAAVNYSAQALALRMMAGQAEQMSRQSAIQLATMHGTSGVGGLNFAQSAAHLMASSAAFPRISMAPGTSQWDLQSVKSIQRLSQANQMTQMNQMMPMNQNNATSVQPRAPPFTHDVCQADDFTFGLSTLIKGMDEVNGQAKEPMP